MTACAYLSVLDISMSRQNCILLTLQTGRLQLLHGKLQSLRYTPSFAHLGKLLPQPVQISLAQ